MDETPTTTYTYTARSVENPEKVLTFTLYDGHMRVNLTGVMDQADAVAKAEDRPGEIKHQVAVQAKPALMKFYEEVSGPVAIRDVKARLHNDDFEITTWPRVAGLRLAPVRFDMGEVDNTDAAENFIDELKQRKQNADETRKFFGPLDYWLGWIGLLAFIALLLRRPRLKS